MNQFRAIYISAVAVIMIGIFGAVFVPKAHASPWRHQTAPVAQAKAAVAQAPIPEETPLRKSGAFEPLLGFAGTGCLSLAGLVLLIARRD